MNVTRFVWFVFIGLIGFASFTRWQNLSEEPLIMTDGQGYYAYLPAVFIYHDLQFSFVDAINETYYPEGKRANYVVETPTGNVNKYFAGTSVVQAPFFFVGCALSMVLGLPVDGYSRPFQLMVALAAIVSVCLGLFFLGKLLNAMGFKPNIILLTLFLVLFGTNLFYYVIYEPGMSHAYTFFTVSAFLFFVWKSAQQLTIRNLVLAVGFLALTVLIRPTNALIVLAVPVVTSGFFGTLNLIERLFSNKKALLISALIFWGIVAVQPVIYLFQTGQLMVWSYEGEGFHFLAPEIFNVLFGYRKGLVVYCPILFVTAIGLAARLHRNRPQFGWLLFVLAAFTWVISSWWMWYYGGCYGHRAFIDVYPLFAIGLAAALQYGLGFLKPWLLTIAAVALVPMQLVQTYQYVHNIIPFDNMSKVKFWSLFMRTGNDLAWYYSGYPGEDSYLGLDSLVIKHGLEEPFGWGNEQQITNEAFYTGAHSALMLPEDQYGITFRKPVSEVAVPFNLIRVSGWVRSDSRTTDLSFVCAIDDSTGSSYVWKKYPLRPQFNGRNEWSWVTAVFKCGAPRDSSDKVVVYPMKSDGAQVYIDDFEITFIQAR
ncbi:MAG: hypothetical protein K9J17_01815 [Flavobacteriales bacterium]|nr:hypothetical protein [Flavobacteriales bacterium]